MCVDMQRYIEVLRKFLFSLSIESFQSLLEPVLAYYEKVSL